MLGQRPLTAGMPLSAGTNIQRNVGSTTCHLGGGKNDERWRRFRLVEGQVEGKEAHFKAENMHPKGSKKTDELPGVKLRGEEIGKKILGVALKKMQ